MTNEIMARPETEKKPATVGESIALFHKGHKIVSINPEVFQTPTLDTEVGKPFEAAKAGKTDALALKAAIDSAVRIATESHSNPLDIQAELDARFYQWDAKTAPEAQENGDIAPDPYIQLRQSVKLLFLRERTGEAALITADRLPEAAAAYITALKKRKEALATAIGGSNGVHRKATRALVQKAAVQSGTIVRTAQNEIDAGHAKTQQQIDAATLKHLEEISQTDLTEHSLEVVNEKRLEIMSRYNELYRRLKKVGEQDEENKLYASRAEKDAKIATLKSSKRAAEIRIGSLNHHIAHLQNPSDPNEQQEFTVHDYPYGDGYGGAEIVMISGNLVNEDSENAETALPPTVGEAEQQKRDLRTECKQFDVSIDECEGAIREIDARLNAIHQDVKAQRELEEVIIADIALPLLVTLSPIIQEEIDQFRRVQGADKKQFAKFSLPVQRYLAAEEWFEKEFAPKLIQQLKNQDPDTYASLKLPDGATYTGPVTASVLANLLNNYVGNITLGRRRILAKNSDRSSHQYGVNTATTEYNNAANSRLHTLRAEGEVAQLGIMKVDLSDELGEVTDTLNETAGEATRQLIDLELSLTEAIGRVKTQYEEINLSRREEHRLRLAAETSSYEYERKRQETEDYLAKAKAAGALLDDLKEQRRAAIMKRASEDEFEGENEPVPYADRTDEARIAELAQRDNNDLADMSSRHAEAHKRDEAAHARKLRLQEETTAKLLAGLYPLRKLVADIMEAGADCGDGALRKIYEETESTIAQHEGLALPVGATEKEIRQRTQANGNAAIAAIESSMRAETKQGKLQQTLAIARTAFQEARGAWKGVR